MNWNVSNDRSPEHKYSPTRSIQPKNRFNQGNNRKRNLLTSKSSMMGVLGVVPEENDSDHEDGQLNVKSFDERNDSHSKQFIKLFKNWNKLIQERPFFITLNAIIQSLYILCVLIFFFLSYDVDVDNMYGIIITMVSFL